ncbi:ORF6N domain-containing protein [Dickeya ananatis]|uniref:ORF6N domain-containing protein n=2 Tax=Dickeya ananatis TaxID=3061286 RepID=UPI003890CB59
MTTFTVETLPAISHNSIPVITTELLAQLYGTGSAVIRKNHSRNQNRFVCGKHYYKVTGNDLDVLRVSLRHSQISPKTRALILWTERGAARHAKMLETDQAWDVFEMLEDHYFNQCGDNDDRPARKTRQSNAKQLIPLRQTVERLIAHGMGNIYPDIWKLVHQRFDVEHIHQLQPEQVGEAIEYLNTLEGEYLGRNTLPVVAPRQFTDEQLCVLAWLWRESTLMFQAVESIYPLLRVAEHRLAGRYYSITHECPRTLQEAKHILAQATMHIQYEPWRDDNWSRVLPHLRQKGIHNG